MAITKTNAMRRLDAAKIPYRVMEYVVDENDLSGTHIAEQIGLPYAQVFKTLVAKGEKSGPVVFCIPCDGEIDLKKVADAIKEAGAEIVCLNEVYGKGAHPSFTAQAKQIAEYLDYEFHFAPAINITGAGPYGNCFVSKYPIISAETVPVPTVPRNHPGYFEGGG